MYNEIILHVIEVDSPAAGRNHKVPSVSENNVDMESSSVIPDYVVFNIQVFTDIVERCLCSIINTNRRHFVLLSLPVMNLCRQFVFDVRIFYPYPRPSPWSSWPILLIFVNIISLLSC